MINDGPSESTPEKFVAAKYSSEKVILIRGFHGLGKKGLRQTVGRTRETGEDVGDDVGQILWVLVKRWWFG